MIEIKKALSQALTQLELHSPSARIDCEILLAHILKKTRTYLYTHPDSKLTKEQCKIFQELVNQRIQGFPIAYLIGNREFWSMSLKVCSDTLIPRPETELLVERCLAELADQPQAYLLDLGTGSGAIALACASERPSWQITACDYSQEALKIAQENAANLGLKNINFCQSNWFEKIDKTIFFDLIVSNPPYIANDDPHLFEGDVRFEPKLALVSGEDGLTAITHIIQHSLARLKPNGLLLIEHGYNQKLAIRSMLKEYGYTDIQCWQDWQGNDRVSGGRWR